MVSISVKVKGMFDVDKFKQKLLRNIASDLKSEADNALDTVGRVYISAGESVYKEAVKGVGELKSSVKSGYDFSEGIAWIGTASSHAPYVEFGTGLYGKKKKVIKARKTFMKFKKPPGGKKHAEKIPGNIAFEKDGYVFTKMIRGMRPRPFMRPALFQVGENMEEIVNRSLKQAQVG